LKPARPTSRSASARYLAHEAAAKVLPLAQKLSEAIVKRSRVAVSATEWRTDPTTSWAARSSSCC